MQKTAIDLVAEILPVIKPKDRMKFLFNCTAYPCGGLDTIRSQLEKLARHTDGTYEGCFRFCQGKHEKEVDLVMS